MALEFSGRQARGGGEFALGQCSKFRASPTGWSQVAPFERTTKTTIILLPPDISQQFVVNISKHQAIIGPFVSLPEKFTARDHQVGKSAGGHGTI